MRRSPFAWVQRGEAPYQNLGFGNVRRDWPWCPVWFWRYTTNLPDSGDPYARQLEFDGCDPYVLATRAYTAREGGYLSAQYEGPYTEGFLSLISLVSRLEVERVRREAKG